MLGFVIFPFFFRLGRPHGKFACRYQNQIKIDVVPERNRYLFGLLYILCQHGKCTRPSQKKPKADQSVHVPPLGITAKCLE
jgi:hypothetical protein